MHIERAAKTDYAALAQLWNTVYPEDSYTADEFYHLDTAHEAPCRCARFVLKEQGEVVASSSYLQFIGMYHPQKFMVNVFVHPDARGRGLGRALYRHLLSELAPFEPISFSAQVRETLPDALRFAEARGFREIKRDWIAVLDMSRFDPAPYRGLEPRLAEKGVLIKRLSELGETPETRRRLHALFGELRQDVPRSEPATPIGYEQFEKLFLQAPDFFPEGLFLAMHQGEFVGMTMFWKGEQNEALHTGLTGVKRAYRGQGLATALKVKALTFAKTLDIPKVYTDNDTKNVEMIAVNAKLGFERQPAWISLRRTIEDVRDA